MNVARLVLTIIAASAIANGRKSGSGGRGGRGGSRGSSSSSFLDLNDIFMKIGGYFAHNEVPEETTTQLSYWPLANSKTIVPAIGTTWNISLIPSSDIVEIDFVISGEHEKTQNAIDGYRSALIISFRFKEESLILNSHRDKWDFEKKFSVPVIPGPGKRNAINVLVSLGKKGFLVIISDFWRHFYGHKLPYWEIKEIRVYGDTWSEINVIAKNDELDEGEVEHGGEGSGI